MKSQKPLENKCHMSKTIESLDGPPDEGADAAWRVEIERRIGQIERGEVELIPGEEVFARLRRRLG